jgi:CRISPR-associated protein (TIGR03986 family)
MSIVEFSNLTTVSEAYIRQRMTQDSKATFWRGIKAVAVDPAAGTVRVTFAEPSQAAEAVKRLHNLDQGKKKRIRAVLIAPEKPAAPATASASPAPSLASPATPSRPLERAPASSATGPECRSRPPFHFVPVLPERAVTDTPVYHGRLDLAEKWTGEVRCTLTALTPLLAANDQYELKDAEEEVRRGFEGLLRQRLKSTATPEYDPDKKILVPLFLPGEDGKPGPVLLGGAALKGMVRQSMAALLSAPMERVQERHFSYRPNVDLKKGESVRLRTKAGLVTAVLPDGGLKVRVLDFNDITPIREEDVLGVIGCDDSAWREQVERLRSSRSVREFDDRVQGLVRRVRTGRDRHDNRAVLPYRYGLDGCGVFNEAFNRRHPEERREPYFHVGVRTQGRGEITIPAPVVEWWRETVRHLMSDEAGHLLRHPDLQDLEAEAGRALSCLLEDGWRPGDVLYFEQEGERGRVVSMGHHFRYRWRYRGTVRTTMIREQRAGAVPPWGPEALRAILCPRPVEMVADSEGRPERLSGARLLFGYVGTRDGAYQDREPTTGGLGLRDDGNGRRTRSDFSQMAGRIAFNAAVEQDSGDLLEKRFLNAAQGLLVPLRPLGSPKPSAVEHYLDQSAVGSRPDNGILCTFGDDEADATAGDLLGRKFYLHQPMAALSGERSLYELLADGKRPRFKDEEMLGSKQAGVGHCVSKPGRAFRFRVRFVNLREWELGALLFTLSPAEADLEAMATAWGADGQALREWLKKKAGSSSPSRPLLAHKLGHGRPLGLGSVGVQSDALLRLTDEGGLDVRERTRERARLVGAFAVWLMEQLGAGLGEWVRGVLLRWLAVHQFAGRELESFDYPRDRRDPSEGPQRRRGPAQPAQGEAAAGQLTIFNHHANLRARHTRGRKQQAPQAPRPRHGILDIT